MKGQAKWGLVFLVVSVLPVLFVIIYPLVHTIVLSLTRPDGSFTLHNYRRLFGDGLFLYSIQFTFIFAVGSVGGGIALGLSLAAAIRHIRGGGYLIPLIMAPYMMPAIVCGIIWRVMFHPTMGIANSLLSRVGLGPVMWLSSSAPAIMVVILAYIWRTLPFYFLLLYSALHLVPSQIYEAARIDGASNPKVFFFISIPHILPTLIIVTMFGWINIMRSFALIVGSTEGGPGTTTWNLILFTYNTAFRSLEYHYAASATPILLLLSVVVGLVLIRFVQRIELARR